MSYHLNSLGFTTPTVGFYVKSGTFEFLQQGTYELAAILTIMQAFGYSNTKVYILYGCRKSSLAGNTTISEGAIFYNGSIYYHPLETFPDPAGADVVIANTITTQYTTNADPTEFTDGNTHDIHDIINLSLSTGAAGSGNLPDYSDFEHIGEWVDAGTPVVVGNGGGSIALGVNFSSRFKVNGLSLTWKVKLQGMTTTGVVNTISIDIPIQVSNIGLKARLDLFNLPTGFAMYETDICTVNVVGGTTSCLTIRKVDGTDFSTGVNKDLSFTIVFELEYA